MKFQKFFIIIYKSASGQLQNGEQLQNNPINGVMLITISRAISLKIFILPLLIFNGLL